MEALIIKLFSEQGIIYGLFFLIVGGFILKGVPFVILQFKELQFTFTNSLQELQQSHRKDIDTISNIFIEQIKESNNKHIITHRKLDEIKSLIKK